MRNPTHPTERFSYIFWGHLVVHLPIFGFFGPCITTAPGAFLVSRMAPLGSWGRAAMWAHKAVSKFINSTDLSSWHQDFKFLCQIFRDHMGSPSSHHIIISSHLFKNSSVSKVHCPAWPHWHPNSPRRAPLGGFCVFGAESFNEFSDSDVDDELYIYIYLSICIIYIYL